MCQPGFICEPQSTRIGSMHPFLIKYFNFIFLQCQKFWAFEIWDQVWCDNNTTRAAKEQLCAMYLIVCINGITLLKQDSATVIRGNFKNVFWSLKICVTSSVYSRNETLFTLLWNCHLQYHPLLMGLRHSLYEWSHALWRKMEYKEYFLKYFSHFQFVE